MPEGLILKSASYEAGGDEAREEHLEAAMENAGFEVVVPAGPEADAVTQDGTETLPPRKSRKERAIERATAPLLEKIKQLETGAGTARPTGAEAGAARPKPKRADFAQDEDFEDSLVQWANERFVASKAVEDTQAALGRHLERNLQNYAAQTKDAKSRYADWDKVVNQDIFIGRDTQLAILEVENGAEVIYYLGRHPAKAAELGKLNPVSAIVEVGRLSARLTGASSGEDRRPPRSRVPAPVQTVSTAGSTATPSFADIAARRNYPGKARDLKRALADR